MPFLKTLVNLLFSVVVYQGFLLRGRHLCEIVQEFWGINLSGCPNGRQP